MKNKNNDIVFQCVCEKQFEKKTSLTSHKIHCKIYQESVKDEKLKKLQEKESRRLLNGMFKCECCGKEYDGSYGSGRFCSNECKINFIGLKNRQSSPKVKAHLNKLREQGKIQKCAPYGTWKCKICNQIFNTRHELQQHKQLIHNKYNSSYVILKNKNAEYVCPFCGKTYKKQQALGGHIINCKMHPNKAYYDEIHKQQGKTFSEKCKIHPHNNGWLGRKHKKESKEKNI